MATAKIGILMDVLLEVGTGTAFGTFIKENFITNLPTRIFDVIAPIVHLEDLEIEGFAGSFDQFIWIHRFLLLKWGFFTVKAATIGFYKLDDISDETMV